MSQADVESIRKGYAAFNAGDREGMRAVLDPEVTWYPALGLMLKQTSYHGPEAICELVLEEIPSVLEGFHADLIELEDHGDAVIVKVRFTGTATSTGLEIEQNFFQLWRTRNHKGVEMRSFTTRAEALDAAGLAE